VPFESCATANQDSSQDSLPAFLTEDDDETANSDEDEPPTILAAE
jgi:hypothetical protein